MLKVEGTCTIKVTLRKPLPSSLKAMASMPATLPSPLPATPLLSTFGP